MKKIISLLLAFVMAFSMCTVAFANGTDVPEEDITTGETGDTEGEVTPDDETTEEAGDFDWLLDLPFWTVKPAAKIAKIALKFAKVFVKLGVIFGFIDKNDIIGQIEDLIAGAMGNNGAEEDVAPEEAPEVETTEAQLAA